MTREVFLSSDVASSWLFTHRVHISTTMTTSNIETVHPPIWLMWGAALQNTTPEDIFMVYEPHFFLAYCKSKRELKIAVCIYLYINMKLKKGLHPYFIKNPVSICNSSLDHYLYPLWVVFIWMTVITLEAKSKGSG